MATKSKKPAARGFVNNIILESLLSGDKYGYEIIKEVEEKSGGKISLKQPSLYSSLKRFESKGFITSYWGDSDIGGRRHYYSLTEIGKQSFKNKNLAINDDGGYDNIEPQSRNKNISFEDILNDRIDEDSSNLEIETNSEINKQIDILKNIASEDESSLNENDNKEDETDPPEFSNEDDVNPDKQNVEKDETKPVDINSEEYDIFEVLSNKQPTPPILSRVEKKDDFAIQKTMFEVDHDAIIDIEEEKINVEEFKQIKVLEEEKDTISNKILETEQKKDVPLIKEPGQDYFNWEDLKRKISSTLNKEAKKLNDDVKIDYQKDESGETHNENSTQTNIKITQDGTDDFVLKEKNLLAEKKSEEVKITKTAPKKEFMVIIDEYGIMKSSEDYLPPKQKSIIDNVKERIDAVDPIHIVKSKKEQSTKNNMEPKDLKTNNTANPVKFEEQNKNITSKLNTALNTKKKKTDTIDFKNILGDFYADENTLQQQANDTALETLSEEDEYKQYEYVNTHKKIKSASLTSLEDTLNEEGFKFKPYITQINEEKKPLEFLLINKAKLFFGLTMFVLMTLQLSTALILLIAYGFNFKPIDYVVLSLFLGIASIIMLTNLIPFIINSKRRKINDYNLKNSFLLMLLLFASLTIITYSVNSLFSLTFTNILNYSVTLLVPIALYSNLIIAPLVYKLIIINKRMY